jgi:hypothetical protein
VDYHEEIGRQTAGEISELWQVPVKGLTPQELNQSKNGAQKVLAGHIVYKVIGKLLAG